MRRRKQVSTFLAAGICVVQSAAAFGPEGHRLVGEIAEHHLCTDARREVGLLLDGQSLARAGNWPDWIRSRSEWAHTRPWHYMNVGDEAPIAEAAVEGWSVNQSREPDDVPENVLSAIAYFDRRFADPSRARDERAEALRFLAHFVADVHQPLHVGRAEDRGGNTIDVRVDGRATNLHAVWDAQKLLKAALPVGSDGRQARFSSILGLTAGRAEALQGDDPVAWALESQALRPAVYAFDRGQNELDAAYLAGALEIVDRRLSEAGVRLAGRINRVYCVGAQNRQQGRQQGR